MYPFYPFCLFLESLTYVFATPTRVRLPPPPPVFIFSNLQSCPHVTMLGISSPSTTFGRGFLFQQPIGDRFSTTSRSLPGLSMSSLPLAPVKKIDSPVSASFFNR